MSVRTAFSKNGGNMGETGSVSFMFDQVGKIEYPLAVADARRMCLFADIKVESDGRSATIFFIRV